MSKLKLIIVDDPKKVKLANQKPTDKGLVPIKEKKK